MEHQKTNNHLSPNTLTYQPSYWECNSFLQQPDLLIIGSGIVGLSAAISAREKAPSANILILERGTLPIGASTRNAGFACFGSLTELLDDLENGSEEEVYSLVEQRWRGLQQLRQRVGDIKLDYQSHGGYELFRPDEKQLYEQCLDRLPELNKALASRLGEPEIFSVADPLIADFGFGHTAHLLKNRLEGQIDTGQMMASLLRIAYQADIRILNGVEVVSLDEDASGVRVRTAAGWEVKARQVLIATNGFARQLIPDVEVQPARNQVLITRPLKQLPFRGAFHYDKGYCYFRNIHNRIMLGGARNLNPIGETTDTFGTTQEIQQALTDMLQQVIAPGLQPEVDYWWSGIMGVGARKAPIVKKYSEKTVIAVRLGGMGVAIGSEVGAAGAEMIINGQGG
jgi:hypothetical protein